MREGMSQVRGQFPALLDGAAPSGGMTLSPVLPGHSAPAGNSLLSDDAVLPGDGVLPVLPALAELLPAGGLAKGSVVTVERSGLLGLALVAGASAAGAWCGVAGIPDLGVIAAAGVGVEPARLMLVPDPGPGWPQVVASMLDACEVVVVRPPARPSAQARRRLEAVLRRGGGVLVVTGDWDGAPVRLRVASQSWVGIGDGYGRLRGCRAEVVAEGRGAAARPRRRWLWLPGPDGAVSSGHSGTLGHPETVDHTGPLGHPGVLYGGMTAGAAAVRAVP
jgi:hypothetical protein